MMLGEPAPLYTKRTAFMQPAVEARPGQSISFSMANSLNGVVAAAGKWRTEPCQAMSNHIEGSRTAVPTARVG